MAKDTKKDDLSDEQKIALAAAGVTIGSYTMYEADRQYRESQRAWEEFAGDINDGNDVKVVRDPDVKVVRDPDVKVVRDPDVKIVHDPDVKIVRDPDVKIVHDPDVKIVRDPDVKIVHDPDVSRARQKKDHQSKKEAGRKHYEKKKAAGKARKKVLKAGKSQKVASRVASKSLAGNKTQNLRKKMKKDSAKAKVAKKKIAQQKSSAKKQAPAKPKQQQLSFWQRAKNKAKSYYNKAKTAYKQTKGKVSKALDKTWAGKQVKKVVRPVVKVSEAAARGAIQGGKKVYKATKPYGKRILNSRVVKQVVKYAPKAAKALKGPLKMVGRRLGPIGVVVSVGCAGYEALQGNWGKAALNLGAGALALVPSVTCQTASLAIDAALMADDFGAFDKLKNKGKENHTPSKSAKTGLEQTKQRTQQQTNQQVQQQTKQRQKPAEQRQGVRECMQSSRTAATNTQGSVDAQNHTENEQQVVNNSAQSQAVDSVQNQTQNQGSQPSSQNNGTHGQSNSAQGLPQSNSHGAQQGNNFNVRSVLEHVAKVSSEGDSIVLTTGVGKTYTLTQAELEKQMSAKRAKGTMEKLQKVVDMRPQPVGLTSALSAYIPEFKKEGKGSATVNRNLVDSAVKAIGGSSKVTSITIDGKKIKADDIQLSYGCSKKEAKQILKAYGRAIEDGANMDNVLRDIASGKKLSRNNSNPYYLMTTKSKSYS